MLGDGWTVPVAPLIGCLATAPATETVLSRHEGDHLGNVDVREITAGATVVLPVAVAGGGLYFGLYQFNLGTWHGVGGAGNPVDASSAEQTYRAKLLYRNRGSQPWPVCGHLLYT